MNYQETLQYLYAQLPMYQRVGGKAYNKSLDKTIAFCDQLGNPHKSIKTIHVAGSNGKGSVSHILSAIFQSAGYKTGLYTSPHLKDFSERIRIDGDPIKEPYVIDFVEKHKGDFESIQPSFFEMTVGLAFDYFKHEGVDIAIIEVGMGGRLDSTNIITPELSIITNISFDHKEFLGSTLAAIAGEKAGIIKQGVPVVVGEYLAETAPVFETIASEQHAPIYFASDHVIVQDALFTEDGLQVRIETPMAMLDYKSDLSGGYQVKNILTVLKSVDVLRECGWHVPDKAIKNGLAHVKTLTGLKGRWQQLQKKPRIIADVGHNEAGIRETIHRLKAYKYRQLRIVWGMVKDKDIDSILSLLPRNAVYYFCAPQLERALDVEILKEQAEEVGLHGTVEGRSVQHALNRAMGEAHKDDLIFVGGSTFVVAEIENL